MELRYLTKEDTRFLYKLRHDPDVIKNSRHKPPTLEQHKEWVRKAIRSPDTIAMVIWIDDVRAGQLNLTKRTLTTCEVSISLMPEFRGKGNSKKALRIAHNVANDAKYCNVLAEVKKTNKASLELFTRQGYLGYFENKRFVTLIKEL